MTKGNAIGPEDDYDLRYLIPTLLPGRNPLLRVMRSVKPVYEVNFGSNAQKNTIA